MRYFFLIFYGYTQHFKKPQKFGPVTPPKRLHRKASWGCGLNYFNFFWGCNPSCNPCHRHWWWDFSRSFFFGIPSGEWQAQAIRLYLTFLSSLLVAVVCRSFSFRTSTIFRIATCPWYCHLGHRQIRRC